MSAGKDYSLDQSVPSQKASAWRSMLCQARNLRDMYIECGVAAGDARRRAIVSIEQRADEFMPVIRGETMGEVTRIAWCTGTFSGWVGRTLSGLRFLLCRGDGQTISRWRTLWRR